MGQDSFTGPSASHPFLNPKIIPFKAGKLLEVTQSWSINDHKWLPFTVMTSIGELGGISYIQNHN